MSISLVFLMACVAVASALVLLSRVIGVRRILRHATVIDVGFAVVAGIALHSSIIGILIAILGGLVMALVLQVGRVFVRASERATEAAKASGLGMGIRKWGCPSGGLPTQPARHPMDDDWEPTSGWSRL